LPGPPADTLIIYTHTATHLLNLETVYRFLRKGHLNVDVKFLMWMIGAGSSRNIHGPTSAWGWNLDMDSVEL
jgi:hypothetical protein